MPPIAVRRHETCGLALMAIVASVPVVTRGVPPGVIVGDVVTARRAMYCVYAVKRMTGKPRPITTSAPGKTQSGSPKPAIAAFGAVATTMHATAYTASAFLSIPRPPRRIDGIAE